MTNPPIEHLTVVPLTSAYAPEAARLHRMGQPGTFLTALGDEVLTVLYRLLPQSKIGLGFAAIDPLRPQSLLGFVSATTSVATLFLEMGLRRFPDFAPVLLHRFIQKPALTLRATETILYPFLHEAPEDRHEAPHDKSSRRGSSTGELLSIMVKPGLRGLGLGSLLVAVLKAECWRRGLTALDVTVAAANQGAQRFYVRHGFTYRRTFSLYGQPMHLYRAPLVEE